MKLAKLRAQLDWVLSHSDIEAYETILRLKENGDLVYEIRIKKHE